ncbi:MAG TPA: hypothetical protein VFL91_20860, partial [Thermomicrobiales bacterium]|nr:hypothetical protein [Thermomicrobiales bacterium]
NLTVTAGAAMPLATLHAALAARRLRCPLPEGEGTVGAALSDAAARPAVRDSLLGVWATLPDGQPVHFGSSAVKDVAGYDMKRLYIGTGDAFGAVERVTLKVRPERSAPGGA